jgi:hypothetical protein
VILIRLAPRFTAEVTKPARRLWPVRSDLGAYNYNWISEQSRDMPDKGLGIAGIAKDAASSPSLAAKTAR